jgi:hypothetical protein
MAQNKYIFSYISNAQGNRHGYFMVDNFSILLSHILIALAFWQLSMRDDLDDEPPPAPDETPPAFIKRKNAAQAKDGHPHA